MKHLAFVFLFTLTAIEGLVVNIVPDSNIRLQNRFCSKEECKNNMQLTWDMRIWGMIHHFAIETGGRCRFTNYREIDTRKKEITFDANAVIFWNVPFFVNLPKIKAIPKKFQYLFLLEPPTVIPMQYNSRLTQWFQKIFTWDDDLVDNKNYFKFRYAVLRPPISSRIPFSKKKLCCMIIGNKESKHPKELYSKRRFIIESLNSRGDFDLYGAGWEASKYQCYKGAVEDKIEVASHYKFSFCLENMGQVKGYITEKIFDAFASLSVPIYEGASNITEEIPEDCFIDLRKFSSIEELMGYLTSMDEEAYNTYIANILAFLESDAAKKYSVEAFFENMKTEIFDTL